MPYFNIVAQTTENTAVIVKLNAEIAEIAAKENILKTEIDKIIAEIEV